MDKNVEKTGGEAGCFITLHFYLPNISRDTVDKKVKIRLISLSVAIPTFYFNSYQVRGQKILQYLSPVPAIFF